MNRQMKTAAGLAAVLLALSGLATWDEWKTKQEEKDKESKDIVLSVKPDQVRGVHIVSRPDSETGDKAPATNKETHQLTDVTLKFDNNNWTIKSPIESNADQQAVSDLLKSLTEYKSEAEVAADRSKWASFGLVEPRRKIELELADGKKIEFLVGINAPVGFSAYVATSLSDKVFSGSQYIATSTGKTLFDLRDKKVIELSGASIKDVKIKYSKDEVNFSRNAEGKWNLLSNAKDGSELADRQAVNNLLDDLTSLKATEFIDHPNSEFLTQFKKDATHSKWSISTSDGKSLDLAILESPKGLFVKTSANGTYFKIGSEYKVKLHKTFDDLRNKKIFDFESAMVTAVKIDGQEFKKKDSDWVESSDESKKVSHVRGLLVDLEFAKAEAVLGQNSKVAANLAKSPMHKIVLKMSNGELHIDTWDAADNKDISYLKSGNDNNIYQVKKNLLANITPQTFKPAGDEMMPQSNQ